MKQHSEYCKTVQKALAGTELESELSCTCPEVGELPKFTALLRHCLDEADEALDKDTYEQKSKDGFNAPDEAEYTIRVSTLRKVQRLFTELDSQLKQ